MDGNTSGDGKEDTLKLYETDEKGYFDLSRSRSVYGSAECTEVGSSVSHHAISAHQDVLDCFAEICSRPYILDIDLDLFSTTDPFRDEVCPEVASLLCQLFSYTLPADQSTEVSKSVAFDLHHLSICQPTIDWGCTEDRQVGPAWEV